MQRTGSRLFLIRAIFYIPFLLLILNGLASAQSVTVDATLSETTIYTGEQVTLTVEVEGNHFKNISRPKLPKIEGLQYLSTTPATSTNYSFINGVSNQSYSYSYYLQAEKAGKYTIPPVTVSVDGKDFRTEPIKVTIVDRNKAANSAKQGNLPDIFLKMAVSDEHPVLGQQIIASVVLYFKTNLQVSSYQPMPGWKADGFWKEELDENKQPRASQTIINGERYNKAILIKYALFPSKQNDLSLSPYQIQCVVSYNSGYNDPFSSFFGGFGTNQRTISLQTDPIDIHVRPLPPKPSNARYIDAVGQFKVTRTISQNSVKEGESVEVTTTIKGVGNIALISKPNFQFPNSFEAYQPQQNSSIDRNGNEVTGTKTFTDVLVARKLGKFEIPAANLAFYNNITHKYQVENLPSLPVTVIPNPNMGGAVAENNSLGLTPITGLASWTEAGYRPLLQVWWVWIGLLLPLLILGVGYWQKTYKFKMLNDSRFARSKTAYEKAKSLLGQSGDYAKNEDMKSAYSCLHQSLSGFIGDKLNLPQAGISDEEYLKALIDNHIESSVMTKVKRILDKCSTIRFAPLTSQEDFNRDALITQEILTELRKVL